MSPVLVALGQFLAAALALAVAIAALVVLVYGVPRRAPSEEDSP